MLEMTVFTSCFANEQSERNHHIVNFKKFNILQKKSLSGTKEAIFDVFLEKASTVGVENIGVRGIAKEVGIAFSSISNHFETKGALLQFAYDYYAEHRYDSLKPIDEMKKLIETASPEEFLQTISYTFESSDQKKYVRMILITKIIYMRLFSDPVANALFIEGNKDNAKYLIEVLKHGMSIGRIAPDLDIETFADVLIGSRVIMGVKAFATPEYTPDQLDDEKRILALLAQILI